MSLPARAVAVVGGEREAAGLFDIIGTEAALCEKVCEAVEVELAERR